MKKISNEELYKECYNFLEKVYFPKSKEDIYTRASNRAYLDFCRTFHTAKNTEKLRREAAEILKRNIEEILDEKIINQEAS